MVVIIVVSPQVEFTLGVADRVEDHLVQAFVPELPIKTLDEPVLLGLPRRVIVQGDARSVPPVEHGLRRECASVVRHN